MSRRTRAGVVMLLLVATGAGVAAAEMAVETWEADAGTTVALVEDHRVPLVNVRLVFPAGRWSPWLRESHAGDGFEIQLHDDAGELRARADRLATGIYVGVGNRTSVLWASCLKEDWPEVLELIRDVLGNREFDRRELRRRNQSRRLDWESALKSPAFRGQQAVYRGLFAADDPRRLGFEEPDRIETDSRRLAAARDTLLRLPGRIVGLAGDLTREEAERSLRDLLPPTLESPPVDLEPRFGPITPFERREQRTTVRLPRLTQVYFGYGRESLTYSDPDYPAFVVADHVLGGHFYSRLYVALRHEGGETYGAGSSNRGDTVVGPYGMVTFTRAANAAATEAKLREVLRLFHAEGITEEERAAAVGSMIGGRAFDRQAPEQVLYRFLNERALGLPAGYLDRQVERAAAVPLAEINALIRRYYDPDRFTIVLVAPE